jgi:heparanase
MASSSLCRAGAVLAAAALAAATAASPTPLTLSVTPAVSWTTDALRTSVNFDFWPTTKSKWGGAGALILNLTNPDLLTVASALAGSGLRIGGSPADFLLYDVTPDACSPSNLNKTQQTQPGGYFCPIWLQAPGQCLTMQRWGELNAFARTTGLRIILDLNACWGRENATADMDWTLIDGLLAYTHDTLYAQNLSAVHGFEFGNEVYDNVAAARYGASMARMRATLDGLWGAGNPDAPLLMGPDAWENDLSPSYYTTMLDAANGSMHAVTLHDYADDCCVATGGAVLNMSCLDALVDNARWVSNISLGGFGVPVWNGEMALHSSSGLDGLTNTFVSSLFYGNALGAYASEGVALVSRQTLQGGDYELVNKSTLVPNPDYYVLLLWRRLVGRQVLKVGGAASSALDAVVRGYAFCALDQSGGAGAAVAVLVNFGLAELADVSVEWPAGTGGSTVDVYQLTGVDGYAGEEEEEGGPRPAAPATASSASWPMNTLYRAALNGAPLDFAPGGPVPSLAPATQAAGDAVSLPPLSLTFVVRQDAGAGDCN